MHMEYYSTIKKLNYVICSDMDGPRYCHTEWSKSNRVTYYITYVWNLKKGTQML